LDFAYFCFLLVECKNKSDRLSGLLEGAIALFWPQMDAD